jgi:hypothetical protein
MTMRRVIGIACVAAALWPAAASAQQLEQPFRATYSVRDLGTPPGVPSRLGGLTFFSGDSDVILIGGEANASTGALYAIRVRRGASGRITGYAGSAVRYADAAYNDGGVVYGPGNVLFLARWPNNELGQTVPGSGTTNKVISMGPLGVASSLVAVGFVPDGYPGAGSFKMSSYGGGQWYDARVASDGAGTYNVQNIREITASQLPGSDGFAYVPLGSPRFGSPSMLVSEYTSNAIGAFELNRDGNPVVASRRTFLTGLDRAVGATIDPVTGDFLFSTFGGGDRVVVVSGFASGDAPALGETVGASVVKGDVRVKSPNGSFVPLTDARTVPVRSIVDTTKGTVKLRTARNRRGKVQSGKFSNGVFQVLQSRKRRAKGLTELRLKGSAAGFKRCNSNRSASAALSRRAVRRLRGNAKGRYRTRGKHSAATVRGTKWTVTDRCDGTLTTVKRGKVAVRDFRLKKTILLAAGKSYLAAAR